MKSSLTPSSEIESRLRRCRDNLVRFLPEAEGLLVFSRLNIFYLTGSLAAGVLWLPLQSDPVLLCRRGLSRSRIESPLKGIYSFRSFRELEGICVEAGSPIGRHIGAEMNGLPWSLANRLQKDLPHRRFLPGDPALAVTRAVKSTWELEHQRLAGNRHAVCLESLITPFLSAGMTEADIARRLWEIFFAQGHHGMLRVEGFGEEVFLGHIAAGESGNYPSYFNGPVGLRGRHPASPFMGSASVRWEPGEPLTIDCGFSVAGYHTDKTQVYWSESRDRIPSEVIKSHDFCVELQEALAEQLVPGALPSQLAAYAFDQARRAGLAEGFMGLGENKVPFVGHGIGLTIDEYPALAEGFDEPFVDNMVIALEPKVGIPGVGIVGTENTFSVTASGGRCLTGHIFDIIPLPGIV